MFEWETEKEMGSETWGDRDRVRGMERNRDKDTEMERDINSDRDIEMMHRQK